MNINTETTPESTSPKSRLATSRILDVDDSKLIRDFVAAVLGREGAGVSTTSNGYAALELCKTNTFDLILVDLRMPEVDGFQTLDLLRSNGVNAPAIAFSAGNDRQEESRTSGFACFMSKPVDRGTLIEKISDLLI